MCTSDGFGLVVHYRGARTKSARTLNLLKLAQLALKGVVYADACLYYSFQDSSGAHGNAGL